MYIYIILYIYIYIYIYITWFSNGFYEILQSIESTNKYPVESKGM